MTFGGEESERSQCACPHKILVEDLMFVTESMAKRAPNG